MFFCSEMTSVLNWRSHKWNSFFHVTFSSGLTSELNLKMFYVKVLLQTNVWILPALLNVAETIFKPRVLHHLKTPAAFVWSFNQMFCRRGPRVSCKVRWSEVSLCLQLERRDQETPKWWSRPRWPGTWWRKSGRTDLSAGWRDVEVVGCGL